MSETASPTRVGIFVLGAAALALGAIVAFGSSRLFEKTDRFVIYFDQSLMGLSLGAPVIFQGVQVGSVVDIHAVLTRIDPPLIKTPVTVAIVEGAVRRSAALPERQTSATVSSVQGLIKTGLRAQLDVQSLVTGQLFVNLAIEPDTEAVFRAPAGEVEIPSIPSSLELVKDTLLTVVEELRRMPLESLGNDLVTIMSGLSTFVKAPATEQSFRALGQSVGQLDTLIGSVDAKVQGVYDEFLVVSGEASELMKAAEKTLEQLDTLVAPGSPVEQEVRAALQEVVATLREVRNTTQKLGTLAENTLDDVDRLVEPGSPLRYEVQSTLKEVRRATEKLGALADQIMTQPDSVLFGRGTRKDAP